MIRSGAALAEAVQEFNKAWFGLARSALDRNIAAGGAVARNNQQRTGLKP